jgi:hypothetical protein
MLLQSTNSECQTHLYNARRFFSLVPLLVFLLTLMLFSSLAGHSYADFLHVLLQSITVSLASVFVSIAGYGFYRYLTERSPGL